MTDTPVPYVIGANYYSTPLAILESIAMDNEESLKTLEELKEKFALNDVAILSTCNRTEVYCSGHVDTGIPLKLKTWLLERAGADTGLEEKHVYYHSEADAVRHLFEVICGLDSMILGETEIVGQVQQCLEAAVGKGTGSRFFIQLFNAAYRTSKRARNETEIDKGTTSVASSAVHMAERIGGKLSHRKALVVGAGETGTLVSKYLMERNASIHVTNRTFSKAQGLAACMSGKAVEMEHLEETMKDMEVVICATSSKTPLITREMAIRLQKERGGRLLHIIDISLPHNVEPQVGEVGNIFLSDMNDLKEVVAQSIAKRAEEKEEVQRIIREETHSFFEKQRTLSVGPLIKALRDSFEELRTEEMAKWEERFSDKDREAVDQLTRSITNKLLHWPTLGARTLAADTDDAFEKAKWFEELFGLDKTSEERKNKK